ncbi:MAG TPA: hypothetical protein VMW28_04880 [Pelolinea sp.]|nr:hypothetical protein [Pelolinea sp.]
MAKKENTPKIIWIAHNERSFRISSLAMPVRKKEKIKVIIENARGQF